MGCSRDKRRRPDIKEDLLKALADSALAVILFVIVSFSITTYKGDSFNLTVHKLLFFSGVFATINLVLRATKRSQSHILLNAVFFQLGSLFAKELVM